MNLSPFPATFTVRYRSIKFFDCFFVAIAVYDLYHSLILYPATLAPDLNEYVPILSLLDTILLIAAVIFAFTAPVYWYRREIAAMDSRDGKLKCNSRLYHALATGIIRYWIAATVFTYAFSRIMGTQFPHIYSRDDLTVSSLAGLDLTQYYFVYSGAMPVIIAVILIVGAVLLLFSRTTVPALLILFPIMLTMVFIRILFSFPRAALVNTILVTAGMVYLLSQYWPLIRTFLTLAIPSLPKVRTVRFRYATRALVIAYSFGLIYYINSTRVPDILVGKWKIDQFVKNGDTAKVNGWLTDSSAWQNVYLEKFGNFTFSPNPFMVDRDRSLTGRYIYDVSAEQIKFYAQTKNGGNDTLVANMAIHSNGQMHWRLTTGGDAISILLTKVDQSGN